MSDNRQMVEGCTTTGMWDRGVSSGVTRQTMVLPIPSTGLQYAERAGPILVMAAHSLIKTFCFMYYLHVTTRPGPKATRTGPVSINTAAVRPGVGPFCYGQITWDDGPSPGRTVRPAY